MKTDEEKGKYIVDRIKLENAALRKYAAIQKAAEDKIGVQKIYVDITGDIEAAFVLDEIIFYTLPRENGKSGLRVWKDGYLWMAVQRAEWWERKRLTPRQSDTAITKLKTQNLIFSDVYKFNGQTTTHLRLNSVEFFKRYSEELEKNNPPEQEGDTLTRDISDLYKMMGFPESRICDSQNGETESRIRETESQNGDSINIPDSSLTQPGSPDLVDLELQKKAKQDGINPALIAFERDMHTPGNWTWYPSRSTQEPEWRALRNFVVKLHAEDPKCFKKYNEWRNRPYVKGAMSNRQIKNYPADFEASWTDYLASSAMYGTSDETSDRPERKIHRAVPEEGVIDFNEAKRRGLIPR